MLDANKRHTSGRAGKNQNDSLEHELTNVILCKMVLTILECNAKTLLSEGT